MAIKKGPSGWVADIRIGGRGGKRYRKTFATKAEALTWEHWLKATYTADPEWVPAKRDTRRLSELIDLWWENAGMQLKAGHDTHATLKRMAAGMSDPTADRFNADMFVDYRRKRIESGISANRVNREHAYLRAMFNELRRMKKWTGANPIADVRQFKIDERELSFLTLQQIDALLEALARQTHPDALLITKICLATGARWGEVQNLRRAQVHGNAIHLSGTKNGRNRSIPISEKLAKAIEGHTYPDSLGDAIFRSSYDMFGKAVKDAGIKLVKGQSTHVLRHTFASHFMMRGGNILALQKILGHSSLTMTMRYAHLSPEHLQEAVQLNPLENRALDNSAKSKRRGRFVDRPRFRERMISKANNITD